jgi:enoyl-CoA hydratase/carnithine racemase
MGDIIVKVHSASAVAEIVLNRPDKRNALTAAMRASLFAELDALGRRRDVSCVLLSGAGPAFCAGLDLAESAVRAGSQDRRPNSEWRYLKEETSRLQILRDLPIPVVVAVHGHCYGAATLMAMFADIVVVASDARIGAPRVGRGAGYLGPVMGYFAGSRKAREIELRYGVMSGSQAEAVGWANYSVPAAELGAFALGLAEDVARQPRDLLELRKAAMNAAQDLQGFGNAVTAIPLWEVLGHFSGPPVDSR